MSYNQSFNRRAVLAGPAGFRKALVEGTNHYIAQAMEIIDAAPHEDLPLVIAALALAAEDLKNGFDGKDWKPGYVDFLTRIVKDSCETTLSACWCRRRRRRMDNILNRSDGPAVRDAEGEALSQDGIRQASSGGISVRQYSLLCCLLGRLEGVMESIPKSVRPFYSDTIRLLEALVKELRPDAK